MIEKQQLRAAVHRAVSDASELSVGGGSVAVSESTVLLGPGAILDSMGFVNFIVALEEEVRQLTDRRCDLLGKISAAQAQGQPISTAGQLVEYLDDVLRF